MTEQIRAPWTPEQVAALNAYQQHGGMHPFTCAREHATPTLHLVAHEDGWHCWLPDCDYRQDWAHAFMAEPRTTPAVVSPPAVDRTDLRHRIAEALDNAHHSHPCPATGSHYWTGCYHPDGTSTSCHTDRRTDAVLAVLPEPDGRAAVLREAADRLWALANRTTERGAGVQWAAEWLRRMADETPQPEPAVHLGGQANAEACPGCSVERRNLPYPFLCPAAPGDKAQPGEEPAS
jgi:hypothetical protein